MAAKDKILRIAGNRSTTSSGKRIDVKMRSRRDGRELYRRFKQLNGVRDVFNYAEKGRIVVIYD